MGDFNYREIDWTNDVCTTAPERATYQFHQAAHDAYLIQHQTTHTRMRDGQEPSVLDLIFSNEEGMVKNLEVHAALGKIKVITRYSLSTFSAHGLRTIQTLLNTCTGRVTMRN